MNQLDGIAKVTKTLASRSAMNPTLLLAAIVVPLSLLFAYASEPPVQTFFMVMAGAVVGVALLQIIGFSMFASHRLNDHTHEENKMIIAQMQARFGQGDNIIQIPDNSVIQGNPNIEGDAR